MDIIESADNIYCVIHFLKVRRNYSKKVLINFNLQIDLSRE